MPNSCNEDSKSLLTNLIIILNLKDWDKNKPTLACFWGVAIGVLIVAYLLRLYTRSRLYKGITGHIDENARKRNPDIGDEALPTRVIVRQVFTDMDVIVRPSVDAIANGFAYFLRSITAPPKGWEISRLGGMLLGVLPIISLAVCIYNAITGHSESVGWRAIPVIVSALAVICILWCRFFPRVFSYFFAISTNFILVCIIFTAVKLPLAIEICVYLVLSAIFLAVIGLNLRYNQDLINGPKSAFEHLAQEAVMLNLPELLFIAIPLGVPITLVSAPWKHKPNWKLWQILLADNLIAITSAWLYHRLLRVRLGNRHRPVPYRILYHWAIVGGIPFSLIWTYNRTWPRYIPLSITASILYFLGTVSYMDYKLLGPLEYEELYVLAAICYLGVISLPWLLFWFGEIHTVDTRWKRGYKVVAAFGINAAEGVLLWLTIFVARRFKRTRGRNRDRL